MRVGSHQCQGWKNIAAGAMFPFKLYGLTLVLKKHSQTLQNFHLRLTSHLHLACRKKTKMTTISKKFLQGALRQQGHNCTVSCCLSLCSTATGTSILIFTFFFF